MKVAQSCQALCDPMTIQSTNSPGQNTGVGSLSFSRGSSQPMDRTQVSHCRWILYQLSHKGSPRTLEWAIRSPADLPNPGIELGSPALQVDSLPTELSEKPISEYTLQILGRDLQCTMGKWQPTPVFLPGKPRGL